MKVLFRVDFGRGVGLGHLRRCLSLAAALKTAAVESLFLSNRHGKVGVRHFFSSTRKGVRHFFSSGLSSLEKKCLTPFLNGILSWSAEDVAATLAAAVRWGCQVILVDSHEVDGGYLAALRKAGFFVIARDDLAGYPFPCQMVINGNANARDLLYRSSSGDTRFLLGPEYAVLPQDFWELPPRVARQVPRNLLVILGGGDAGRAMPRLLALLDAVPGDFTATAVLGPFFEDPGEVRAAAACASRPVEVVPGPDSMRDLMLRADLAVSAAGQTLYELARAGCPTVAVRMAPNQEGQLRAFAAAGAVWPGGSMEKDGDLSEVQAGIGRLLADPGARAAMSAAGRELVDGAGARRVAEAIGREVTQLANA